MIPNPRVPAPASPRRPPGLLQALFAPRRWLENAIHGDYLAELEDNAQLREASGDVQSHFLDSLRERARTRLTRLRRNLAVTLTSLASAVLVGLGFRRFYTGPMLPPVVFGVGSIALLIAATVGLVVWRRRRFDQRVLQVLYWIAVCWGILALV